MATSEPPVSLGFLLWRATLRWQREVATALAPIGLTQVQFALLAVLWWHEAVLAEPPSQRALADRAGTDVMMTSQVLRALERRGLVARHADERDGRVRRLTLTPAGHDLAPQAIDVVEAVDGAFFAGSRDDVALTAELGRLARVDDPPRRRR